MDTYLITGASRGIGAEFVRQLRARGHTVIAAVRNPGAADEARRLGARVVALDVDRPETFERFAADLGPIDVLVNNAAIAAEDGSINTIALATFERLFRTNVFGMALLTRALLPNLRAGRGGRKVIANVTSQLGSMAHTEQGFSYAYSLSKAAVNMLARQEHLELSREGFTVIPLDPGWNKTDMGGPNAPFQTPDTVRTMVALLERLGPADSGKFFRHDDTIEAW